MSCQRQILGVRWNDHVRNSDVAVQIGLPNITETIIKRRHMLFGHVARLDATTPAHQILMLSSPDTSPTLSGGELLDVLVTLGSCRLAMDHH